MSDAELLVPQGARLVHIGFPKTGTTSLQRALHLARDRMPAEGVVYPGEERYHKMPGIAVTGAIGRLGDRPATDDDWRELVTQSDAAGAKRVMISSEWLSQATDDQARRVVEDLGHAGAPVHIVATLRPLIKIMPSSWQQFLQNGLRVDYDTWLRGMLLEAPYDKPTPTFWKRHRHDEVIARWAKFAGPDNVTVIVVDSRDHDKQLRQFEALLGLPDGFLVPGPVERDNRSLSWAEAELLRHVNIAFRKRKWPDSLYRSVVRNGFVSRLALYRPAAVDLQPIPTPAWALERAAAIGAEAARAIAELGVRVVGDLDSLGRTPDLDHVPAPEAPMMPATMAAEAVIGAIAGGQAAGLAAKKPAVAPAKPVAAQQVARRLRPRVRRALYRARRKLRARPQ